jgi:hypothetical protein
MEELNVIICNSDTIKVGQRYMHVGNLSCKYFFTVVGIKIAAVYIRYNAGEFGLINDSSKTRIIEHPISPLEKALM